MNQPDPDLLQSLLLAAEAAGKEKKPSVSEVFDPYRSGIQACLENGMSVRKIYDMMKGQVPIKCSEAAFQKYIREAGYIKRRGKFAGLDNKAIKEVKRKSSASMGTLFAQPPRRNKPKAGGNGSGHKSTGVSLSEKIAERRGGSTIGHSDEEEIRPRVAGDDI